MKTLLLTGVAGFIGAHTLEHFLTNTDWFIVGVDDLEHCGKYERVEQVLSKNHEWESRFAFRKIDLANSKDIMSLPERKMNYIISMASESHVDRSISDPVPFVRNNVELTINTLEYARVNKPDVFIQISTDEVYGAMYDDKPYAEWDRLVPSNPYSASKAMQEMLAISYWRTYDIPVVITNTMNNIGEMQDVEKFVPKVIKEILAGQKVQIHGNKQDIGSRFYLHARNHADALLFILLNRPPKAFNGQKQARPDKYNIVGDTRLTNLEMARAIASYMDIPQLEYEMVNYHGTRPGHDMHYGLSGGKLKQLGWKPPLSFEESLARTVENYMEHKEWLQ